MTSSAAYREGLEEDRAHALEVLMDADRILGALIWCVWNDQLPDELLELIRTSSEHFPKYLAGNNGPGTDLIAMAQGYLKSFDPDIRDVVIASMKEELLKAIENGSSSHEATSATKS
ncbi:MAG TPA: hypothetical protein VFZ76_11010 [Anaerolineales bacterium]